MSLLFDRIVVVEFGLEGAAGKRFYDLAVSFKVKMTDKSTPNSANATIIGLNADSVEMLKEKKSVVRLYAGYQGNAKLIFAGNPIKGGVHIDHTPECVTTLDLQDAGRALRDTNINISYDADKKHSDLIQMAIKQMGLAKGSIIVGRPAIFPGGMVINESAVSLMDRVAAATYSQWSTRNGVVTFYPKGGHTPEQAVSFSSKNGNLIGSAKRTKEGVTIKGLLDASIRPGMVFHLDSRDATGFYVAKDVSFDVDSGYGNPFYVDINGVPRG